MVRKTWIGPPSVDPAVVAGLARELSVPPAVARILVGNSSAR